MIDAAMFEEKEQINPVGYQKKIAGVVAFLLGFGFIMTLNLGYYSSTEPLDWGYFFTIIKFVISAVVGILLALIVRRMSPKALFTTAHILMAVSLILLICTWQYGVVVNGARRWIEIAGIRFQPVEVFKLALALGLGVVFSNIQARFLNSIAGILLNVWIWIAIILSLLLIHLQPNLSAIVMISAVIFVIALLSKHKLWQVLTISFIGAIIVGSMLWVSPEKRNRILAFKYRNVDKGKIVLKDERYQAEMALRAVAAGGWTGVGLGHSIVCYSMPAVSTDFVFAIIVEETGFIGGFLLLAAYFYLISLALNVTSKEKNPFLRLSGVGVILFFTLNVIVHVLVNLDRAPTTGIPLPFISQGGTALLFHLVGVGLILNLARRRDNEIAGIN